MLVLAMDTSANFVSVALLSDEKVVMFVEEKMERGQAEALMPIIERILTRSQYKMSDIQAIAVTVGPGSFTGVRIGLAAARAFGLALNIPVWGVTCFEAWAYHLGRPVSVVLDSKRDDFFVQSFDAHDHPVSQAAILSLEELKKQLPFAAVGTGAEALCIEIGCEAIIKISPIAVAAGRIALARRDHPMLPEPFYMREADVTL